MQCLCIRKRVDLNRNNIALYLAILNFYVKLICNKSRVIKLK